MDISRSFYFIRHGETDWNKEKRLQGSIDIPLNETGREQAKLAAENVKDLPIDLIVTSTLSRAYDTAIAINDKMQKPLIQDANLIEKGYGIFEGLKIEERIAWSDKVRKENPDAIIEPNGMILAEGAEPYASFQSRVFKAINEHLDANPDKTILFVAHAGVFRAIYRHFFKENHQPHNAKPMFFKKLENGWAVEDL